MGLSTKKHHRSIWNVWRSKCFSFTNFFSRKAANLIEYSKIFKASVSQRGQQTDSASVSSRCFFKYPWIFLQTFKHVNATDKHLYRLEDLQHQKTFERTLICCYLWLSYLDRNWCILQIDSKTQINHAPKKFLTDYFSKAADSVS